ncbi:MULTISPECIES: lipase family protein [unclassified Microcoleus]|uniref:lipase family protein n=1 Tax=unclassified Microcoleus TaxID=2642155 RepID=UPI002FD53B28
MKIPARIKKGFDLDEAIMMATFCNQIYDLYRYDDGSIDDSELEEIYNSIHHNQDWKFAHSIRHDRKAVRGFILRNHLREQYAVVFRGTILTDRGAFELTNAVSDLDWDLINYGSMADPTVKVVKGFYEGFDSVADQVKLFFKTILGQLTPKDFKEIESLETERQFACVKALADAGKIKLGSEFKEKVTTLIQKALEDEEIGNDDELKPIFEFLETSLLPLKSVPDKVDVYVTGHSLGGSLSKFCAIALRRWFGTETNSGLNIKAYPIGAPKIGNKAFANYFNRQMGEGTVYRIENTLDLMMRFPVPPPFPLSLFAGDNGLRIGNLFLGNFADVGELHTITGLGSQSISLGTGGALDLGLGIPYPHSFEAFLQLLKEEKAFWDQISQSVNLVLAPLLKSLLQEQLEEIIEFRNKDLKQDLASLLANNGFASYKKTETAVDEPIPFETSV